MYDTIFRDFFRRECALYRSEGIPITECFRANFAFIIEGCLYKSGLFAKYEPAELNKYAHRLSLIALGSTASNPVHAGDVLFTAAIKRLVEAKLLDTEAPGVYQLLLAADETGRVYTSSFDIVDDFLTALVDCARTA